MERSAPATDIGVDIGYGTVFYGATPLKGCQRPMTLFDVLQILMDFGLLSCIWLLQQQIKEYRRALSAVRDMVAP